MVRVTHTCHFKVREFPDIILAVVIEGDGISISEAAELLVGIGYSYDLRDAREIIV